MSTSRRKPEDEVWFVHAPLKNEKRPIVQAIQPSNIPYLNGVMDTEEELNRKPVVWFKDTDSEFIKLSKLGGREDLLIHREKAKSKEPVPYPIPSWWTDMLTEVVQDKQEEKEPYIFEVPAWFAHQDRTNNQNIKNIASNMDHKTDQAIRKQMQKFEAIEEPRKYGQLRNYLKPAKVKPAHAQSQNIYVPSRPKIIESATTMPKLIANQYQQDRPKDYNEWKNKNFDAISNKMTRGSLALK